MIVATENAMVPLVTALAVALAGGAGAMLRHLVDTAFPPRFRSPFSWSLLAINATGSAVLGLVAGLAFDAAGWSWLTIGVLGGYTTFSTASFDTVRLVQERRLGLAAANSFGVLGVCVLLAGLGFAAGRALA